MFANAFGEYGATLGNQLFRIVQTNNAALGIQDDGSRDHRAKQRTAAGFIEARDTRPAQFSRLAFETGATETCHSLE
jgi:hypothetical protein